MKTKLLISILLISSCLTKCLYVNAASEQASLEYVAKCVEAEAGNQDYLGKVYVADCIFNRFDTGKYETLEDVINAPGQFACVKNKSINCTPSDTTYEIVYKEIESRTNSEILYFRTKKYHSFGTPCFKYKAHYFSK